MVIVAVDCCVGVAVPAVGLAVGSPRRVDDAVGVVADVAVAVAPAPVRLAVAARCAVPRATAFAGLRERGIGVNVHYIPIHLQPHYRRLGFRPGQFPNAEAYYSGALSLPLFPQMSEAQMDTVVGALGEVLRA